MPSTVASLFDAGGVKHQGIAAWGQRIPAPPSSFHTAVYVVALTAHPDSLSEAVLTCPLWLEAVQGLLDVRPELTLDGRRPELAELAERLASFWCPDEVVLYIGRAGPGSG